MRVAHTQAHAARNGPRTPLARTGADCPRPTDRGRALVCRPQSPAVRLASNHTTAEPVMSKGMDQKKQEKKKPEKTLKEKRAEKKEKKGK